MISERLCEPTRTFASFLHIAQARLRTSTFMKATSGGMVQESATCSSREADASIVSCAEMAALQHATVKLAKVSTLCNIERFRSRAMSVLSGRGSHHVKECAFMPCRWMTSAVLDQYMHVSGALGMSVHGCGQLYSSHSCRLLFFRYATRADTSSLCLPLSPYLHHGHMVHDLSILSRFVAWPIPRVPTITRYCTRESLQQDMSPMMIL